MEGDRLKTRAEVAEYLDVPVATLSTWAYQRIGPKFYRVGKHARYDMEDVQAWLEEKARDPRETQGGST